MSSPDKRKLTDVAGAILYYSAPTPDAVTYLMQLRDDNPKIMSPGCWALFGGSIEPGEDPLAAVKRELSEEIGHVPEQLTYFGPFPRPERQHHIFYAELKCPVGELVLGEGMEMKAFPVADFATGFLYSDLKKEKRRVLDLSGRIVEDFHRTVMAHR